MENAIKVAPSLLGAESGDLAAAIAEIEKAAADAVHIDIMDGHFVPNLAFSPKQVADLRKKTRLLFDVHLMTETPENFIEPFIDAGADMVTFHAEATPHAHRLLSLIHERGKKAGIALCPGTSAATLAPILPFVDIVLMMTVNPGFGGQRFIAETAPNIALLKKMRDAGNFHFFISVDGGIDAATAPVAVKEGADFLVSGSAFFKESDKKAYCAALRALGTPRFVC